MRSLIALMLLIASIAPVLGAPLAATFETGTLEIRTDKGQNFRFQVQLALSSEQQAQGLMFRAHLPDDAGMLFVNPQPRPMSMWMKNTLIPLDMLFIGADGRIVNIAENTTPESLDTISSRGPVKAVLELNGGIAARLGIRAGDSVVSNDLAR